MQFMSTGGPEPSQKTLPDNAHCVLHCRWTCQRAMSHCCPPSMAQPTATYMWALPSSQRPGLQHQQQQAWCCSFALLAEPLLHPRSHPSAYLLHPPIPPPAWLPCWSPSPTGTCILVSRACRVKSVQGDDARPMMFNAWCLSRKTTTVRCNVTFERCMFVMLQPTGMHACSQPIIS